MLNSVWQQMPRPSLQACNARHSMPTLSLSIRAAILLVSRAAISKANSAFVADSRVVSCGAPMANASVSDLIGEINHSTTYIRQQQTLALPDFNIVAMQASLASTMASNIGGLRTLNAEGANQLTTALLESAYTPAGRTLIANAIQQKHQSVAANGGSKWSLLQTIINVEEFLTQGDWDEIDDPHSQIAKKAACVAARLRKLRIIHPSDDTIKFSVSIIALLGFDQFPDYWSIHNMCNDMKAMLRSLPGPEDVGIRTYPKHPNELPMSVYDVAYDDAPPVSRSIPRLTHTARHHCPTRKTSVLLKRQGGPDHSIDHSQLGAYIEQRVMGALTNCGNGGNGSPPFNLQFPPRFGMLTTDNRTQHDAEDDTTDDRMQVFMRRAFASKYGNQSRMALPPPTGYGQQRKTAPTDNFSAGYDIQSDADGSQPRTPAPKRRSLSHLPSVGAMSFDAGSDVRGSTPPEPLSAGVDHTSNSAPAGLDITDGRDTSRGLLPGVDACHSEADAMTAVAEMERSMIGSMDARAADKQKKKAAEAAKEAKALEKAATAKGVGKGPVGVRDRTAAPTVRVTGKTSFPKPEEVPSKLGCGKCRQSPAGCAVCLRKAYQAMMQR